MAVAVNSLLYLHTPGDYTDDQVQGIDREGKPVVFGRIVEVDARPRYDHTAVVTVAVPVEYARIVRGIARQNGARERPREVRANE